MSGKKHLPGLWVGAPFAAVVLLYVGLALIGTRNNYSPVPFWDMWNGYLGFYAQASEGWAPWWSLHNEHRILFSRALFWLDLRVFHGSMVFLFALNLLFALSIFLCFFGVATRLLPDWRRNGMAQAALGLIGVLSFSWVQSANFTWAFQSQFFSAYLFPLVAFCLLALSAEKASRPLFVLALLVGMLSAATMANGVLASPVLVVLGLFLRLSWKRIAALGIAASLELFGYFQGYAQDYKVPLGHTTLTQALQNQPLDLLHYLLMYLGGPWFFVFPGGRHLFPLLGGLALLASLAYLCLGFIRARRVEPLELALLAFLLFFGGTALGTAGGRLAIGVEQALTSRYLTPQLMAWSALILLYASRFRRRRFAAWHLLPALLIPLALFRWQLLALERPEGLFDHRVAALAVQMDVQDTDYIDRVYFDNRKIFAMAEQAKREHLSIFHQPAFRMTAEQLGKPIAFPPPTCQGYLDGIQPIPGQAGAYRVNGWLLDQASRKVPDFLLIADASGRVVGSALTGVRRLDVAAAIGAEAGNSGFLGYLRIDRPTPGNLVLLGQAPACHLFLDIPAPLP
ncbi:hypothetical protein [Pseudomonas sp. RIT-PI-AD]|uniref:hypothetical protein n=1 Tax=Pseudomonas sp. RIT-PI-AD TaxID=3035294 RepID=UPI0021D8A6F1|nr:hypothetical protein [Pseudomonas sp. RIT-PI-AD]